MINVDELKKELKNYNLDNLTGGDNDVVERSLDNATVYIKAKLKNCGVEPDFTDEVVRLALKKRFLYELYSYAENEEIAKDKKDDAIEILQSYFGSCVKGDTQTTTQQENKTLSPPVVSLTKGTENWNGY